MTVRRVTVAKRQSFNHLTKVFRKGRVERTGRTILGSGETPYMGANYRSGASGSSTGGNSAGTGAPTGTAGEGSVYVDTNTGAVYYFYSGAWH